MTVNTPAKPIKRHGENFMLSKVLISDPLIQIGEAVLVQHIGTKVREV
jgi:hypothetical protein